MFEHKVLTDRHLPDAVPVQNDDLKWDDLMPILLNLPSELPSQVRTEWHTSPSGPKLMTLAY